MKALLTFYYSMKAFCLDESLLRELDQGVFEGESKKVNDWIKKVREWHGKPFPRSPGFMKWSAEHRCFVIREANGKQYDYVPGHGFPLPSFMDPLELFPVASIDARIFFESRAAFELGIGFTMAPDLEINGVLTWEQLEGRPQGRYVLDVMKATSLGQLSDFASGVRAKTIRPQTQWF